MSGEDCSSREDKNYYKHFNIDTCVIEVSNLNFSEGNPDYRIQPLQVSNDIIHEEIQDRNNTEGQNSTVPQFIQTRYETRQSSRNTATGTNVVNKSDKKNMNSIVQMPSSLSAKFPKLVDEFKNNTLEEMQTADIHFTPAVGPYTKSMLRDKVIIPKVKAPRKKRPTQAPRRRSCVTKTKKPQSVVTNQSINNYLTSVMETEPSTNSISYSTSQCNKVPSTNFSTESTMGKPALIVIPSTLTLKELLERNSTVMNKTMSDNKFISIPKDIGAIKAPTTKKTPSLRPNLSLINAPHNADIQSRNCGVFIIVFKKEEAALDTLNSVNETAPNGNTVTKLTSILKSNNIPLHATHNNSSDISKAPKIRDISRKARGKYCNKCVKKYRDRLTENINTFSDVLGGSSREVGGNYDVPPENGVAFKKLQPLSTRLLRCIALLKFIHQPLDTIKVKPFFCDPPQTPENEPSNLEPPDPTSALLTDSSSSDDDDLPDVELGYGMPSVREIVAETRQARHEVRRKEMQKYMSKLLINFDDVWKEQAFLSMIVKHLTSDDKTEWNSTQIVNNILADEEIKNLFTPQEKQHLQENAWSVEESGPIAIIVPNSIKARIFISRCIVNHCKSTSVPCSSYCCEYLYEKMKQGPFVACTALFSNGERCEAVVKKSENNPGLCAFHTWKRFNNDRLRRENQSNSQNDNVPTTLLVSPVYFHRTVRHSSVSTYQHLCTKPIVGHTANYLFYDSTDDPVRRPIHQNNFMDSFITYDTDVETGPEQPAVILEPEKVETFSDMDYNPFEEVNNIVAKIEIT